MVLFRNRRRQRAIRIIALSFILFGLAILFAPYLFEADISAFSYYEEGDSESQVIRVVHYSNSLEIEKHFMIYLPPGYEEEKNKYPTMYLIRGQEQEWFNETNFNGSDLSRTNGTMKEVLDELIKQKAIGKMIVVSPSLTSDVYVDTGLGVSEVIYSFGVNMLNPPTDVPGIGTGKFEDYFLELIHYVDENYRTMKSKQSRIIDGFSAGGHIALKMALQHSDLFSIVGSYDSPIYRADAIDDLSDSTLVLYQKSGVFKHLFGFAFGFPVDTEYFKSHNPTNLIEEANEKLLSKLHFFVQSSPQGTGGNYKDNHYLIDLLASKNVINNASTLEVSEGGHNFASADRHLKENLSKMWQLLQKD